MKPISTRRLVLLGISVAIALVLSYLEALIPPFVAIPGIKLGLANLIVVFLLYRIGAADAAAVSAVRVTLASLLFGSFVSFAYGFVGAALSLSVMTLLKKTGRFSVTGVSVAGAVLHNLGQVAVAACFMQTKELFFYLPVLTVAGTVAGTVIGLAGAVAIQHIRIP